MSTFEVPVASAEERLIEQVVERLGKKHSQVPAAIVVAAVTEAYARFEGHRVREFVPLLVERIANAKLSTPATS